MQQNSPENHDYLWGHTPHQHSLSAVESRLEHLEHRVDKLTLINRALWEILQKEHHLNTDDLLAKMAEIDQRDGHMDHQMRAEAISCPSCGRKTSRQRNRCIYCAAEMPTDLFPSS
ncbi:MAG: hypothetical protein KDN22_13300 [Verrucomicrobiae bacterium]|nr:hypothetical protein [Verrucomicrobiae bacterium]